MKKLITIFAVVFSLGIVAFARPTGATRIQVTPLIDELEANGTKFSFSAVDLATLLKASYDKKTPIPLITDHGDGPMGGASLGWLYGCTLEKNGIWCKVSWTPYGRANACTGAWRFVSPNVKFTRDEKGVIHPTGWIEVSLTNRPAIDGMASVEVPACPVPVFSNLHISHPEIPVLK